MQVTSVADSLARRTARLAWRSLRRDELDHERIWTAVYVIGGVLAVVVPEAVRFKLICPFKALLGLPCLACGSNRALSALVRLEPLRALAWNPLFTLAVLGWGAYVLYALVVVGFDLPRLRVVGDWRPLKRIAVGLAALSLVANWLYLLSAGV